MTPSEAHRKIFTMAQQEMHLFEWGASRVRETQEVVLGTILRANQDTLYGQKFGFSKIRNADEFREKVPFCDYEDITEQIDLIMNGRADVLFPGHPVCLQPTSGTSSASKHIPFTIMLQEQFRAAILPWLYDLYQNEPGLAMGPWYWSLSPMSTQNIFSDAGVAVGFPDDAAYLGGELGKLLRGCFAVPSEITQVADPELARKLTLAFLLRSNDLALISIWNPTFFSILLSSWDNSGPEIAKAIESGELPGVNSLEGELYAKLQSGFGGGSKSRAREILKILGKGEILDQISVASSKLWPHLKTLSCWVDAEAKSAAKRLETRFPAAKIQPKGLIATEGIVSIPLMAADYPVLAIRSHFYEFSPLDQKDVTLMADELSTGEMYQVFLTTGGGLYRYRLGDIIKVHGHFRNAPILEFLGRGHATSDHYGEKLHQLHVVKALREVFSDLEEGSYYNLLCPDGDDSVVRYTLYLSTDSPVVSPEWLEAREQALDKKLRENFHFDYCRQIGQLGKTKINLLNIDPDSASAKFIEEMSRRGLREGDVKPSALDSKPVWRQVFRDAL